MGCSESKHEGNDVLFLCKERVTFVKEAVDSRYALSAAQLSYTQSLHNIGVALRKFVDCESTVESSLSTSEPEKSPSHSSYASPPPSRISPRNSANMSYMKAASSSPLKFTVDSKFGHCVEEEDSLTFPFPPPPPPDSDFSWDFFQPVASSDNGNNMNGGSGINQNFSRLVGLNDNNYVEEDGLDGMAPIIEEEEEVMSSQCKENICTNGNVKEVVEDELSKSKSAKADMEDTKDTCEESEDASKFITHRAKDFISSIKEVEHRFNKASQSGHEVSRMLETKKIRLSISSRSTGNSSASPILSVLNLSCCNAGNVAEDGIVPQVTKVTWNRSISSQSSSSRNPLVSATKDDCSESCSDFIEEFCMISGSHSSTLDRLYAWERKLYDEVKASESVRKAYDAKCVQLRHQFAKDMNPQVIDKTRAIVKDLHSRVRVVIQTVDSISRRIEKLRDEELLPQLLELLQGLIRMWKAMLECHHAQHITISLAYQIKTSSTMQNTESYNQTFSNLQNEIGCFNTSFTNWVSAQKMYVEALNAWLQKCILPRQEKSWKRRVLFSPRRELAPPIFILLADLSAGVGALPSKEVTDALNDVQSDLLDLFRQRQEANIEMKSEENPSFEILKASLTGVFDKLTKFSESSVKVYEGVKQGTEMASNEYINGGRFRLHALSM